MDPLTATSTQVHRERELETHDRDIAITDTSNLGVIVF
jgi:hypothetical protein